MNNENQSPVIPEIDHKTIELVLEFLANDFSIAKISTAVNLPYEVIDKLVKDVINDIDPKLELKKTLLFYNHSIFKCEFYNVKLHDKQLESDKQSESDKHSKDERSLYNMEVVKTKLMKGRDDLLIKLASDPNLTDEKRKIYSPSPKQKEILDILERLGEVDKKTIAKNLNPEVSVPRVSHLMHGKKGKKGKPGLLDLVWGISYRSSGNKNYYKMLYKLV